MRFFRWLRWRWLRQLVRWRRAGYEEDRQLAIQYGLLKKDGTP